MIVVGVAVIWEWLARLSWRWFVGGAAAGAAVLAASSRARAAGGPAGGRGPMPTVRAGSAGAAVRTWQTVVHVSPTGLFDPRTGAATRAWQSARGLVADEIVGPATWRAAGFIPAAPPRAPSSSSSSSAAAGPALGAIGGGGAGGHAWAAALPREGVAAQPAILAAVRAGEAIATWVPLTLRAAGHELTIQVLARALRVGTPGDSVSVTVTYDTAQAIAEALDAYLVTPHVFDAMFGAADVRILPYPQRAAWVTDGTMGQTPRMVQHSDELDAKGAGNLVANEGKAWVISRRIWTDPAAKRHNGPNYGFFDGAGVPVQHVGMVHARSHVDYSQKVYLMRRTGELDGATVDLRAVVRDPALAPLLSDEGPLPDLVHPDLGGAAA